jgi:hypothetical protein
VPEPCFSGLSCLCTLQQGTVSAKKRLGWHWIKGSDNKNTKNKNPWGKHTPVAERLPQPWGGGACAGRFPAGFVRCQQSVSYGKFPNF